MAEVCVNIPVEDLAGLIKSMDTRELETLCLLLSDQGQELQRRKVEVETGRVKPLSRDEAFDV